MKRIKLTQGKYALVDNKDFKFVNQWKWYFTISKGDRYGYAIYSGYCKRTGKRPRIAMHRIIMQAKRGQIVDHKNHNGLDNRRSNLRIVTKLQSAWNRRVSKANKSCGLKGVSFVRDRNGKPVYCIARVTKNNKRTYLGIFPTPQKAYAAYLKASKKLHGEFSCK